MCPHGITYAFTDHHSDEIRKKFHKIKNNACQKENPVLAVCLEIFKKNVQVELKYKKMLKCLGPFISGGLRVNARFAHVVIGWLFVEG